MAADIEMEIVDGVRYRPEDVKAAKERLAARQSDEKSVTPKNKARKAVSNKSADPSDEK